MSTTTCDSINHTHCYEAIPQQQQICLPILGEREQDIPDFELLILPMRVCTGSQAS